MFGGKFAVGLPAVGTNSDYFCSGIRKIFIHVPKLACFLRAALRLVFWIEVDNQIMLTQVCSQLKKISVLIIKREVGNSAPDFNFMNWPHALTYKYY